MQRKKSSYYIINFVVIVLTTAYFVIDTVFNSRIRDFFTKENSLSILLLFVTAFLVHIIKAFRLFLAVYDSGIGFKLFVKTYCKVTPVNMIIPYKLGEIFRVYCYGNMLGKGLKGTIVILFDRFLDTVALLTVIVFTWIVNKKDILRPTYFLLLGIAIVFVGYSLFPGIYLFWKDTFLKAKASRRKNATIRFLIKCKTIYNEIKTVVRGKGVVLYFLSLLAWGVEVGSFLLINRIMIFGSIKADLSDYLLSSLGKNQTVGMKNFVFVSVVLLSVLYIIMTLAGGLEKRKK